MRCPACGSDVAPGERFCGGCGSRVAHELPQAAQPSADLPSSSSPATDSERSPFVLEDKPVPDLASGAGGRRPSWAITLSICGVIAALAVAAAVAYAVTGRTKNTSVTLPATSSSTSSPSSADSAQATPSASSEAAPPPTTPKPVAPTSRALTRRTFPSLPSSIDVAGNDGDSYVLQISGQDHFSDCATHAYGAAMIAFLRSNLCLGADRVLATVDLDGRTAALSIITVTMPTSRADPYGYLATGQFRTLENADGTGIDDLLRDGASIPGVTGGVPQSEAFTLATEDAGTAVFDAWWADGPTDSQDPELVAMENALFLTSATPFNVEPALAPSPRSDAVNACQIWETGAGIDAVKLSEIADSAAVEARQAAALDGGWTPLASAMSFVASLPETGNTQSDIDKAAVELTSIRRVCGTLGVTVTY
jgi:hypothetical protein